MPRPINRESNHNIEFFMFRVFELIWTLIPNLIGDGGVLGTFLPVEKSTKELKG